MAKLILHIGMHKTGSSAIQNSLAAATGNGFIYPQLGNPPFKTQHTDSLVALFSSRAAGIAERYRLAGKCFRAASDDEARIRKAAHDAGSGTVILSSEGAYTFLDKQDLIGLRRFIEAVFDAVAVVAYVRDPYSYISSAFQQTIKMARISAFAPGYKRYRNFLKFDQVMGREKVLLWRFEPAAFPGGDVVRHFTAELGLSAPSVRVNATLSRPAVSAIYRLNRLLGDEMRKGALKTFKRARLAVVEQFPHEEWPAFRLSAAVIDPLIAANSDDMRWIEQRLACSLRSAPEPRDSDIRDEADLLTIDRPALDQLARIADGLPPPQAEFLREALAG